MAQHKMWIGGDWVEAESGKTYPVYNPATEEEIGQIPLGGAADADKAVAAARKALPVWSKKSQAERSQIALKIAAVLREHHDELAALDVMEHGTPAKRADFINADLPEFSVFFLVFWRVVEEIVIFGRLGGSLHQVIRVCRRDG